MRIIPSPSSFLKIWILVVAFSLGVLPSHAWGTMVCTSADIVGFDPGCAPGTSPCTLTLDYEIGDTCILDFSTRSVVVGSTSVIQAVVASQVGQFTIRAATLTVAGGGSIEARGDGDGELAKGGTINLDVTGDLLVDRSASSGRIDVSARDLAGTIRIRAGGSVTIVGRVVADALLAEAEGGVIEIVSSGDLISVTSSQVTALGGTRGIGGDVTFESSASVRLAGSIDVGGSDGGTFSIDARGDVEFAGAQSTAKEAGGSGGCVDVIAGKDIRLVGPVGLRGARASSDGSGGCGGNLSLSAERGDISIEAEVNANGGATDGGGGAVDIDTAGSLTITAGTIVSAAGALGRESCGGALNILANAGVEIAGTLDASGGAAGGTIDACSNAALRLTGTMSATGAAAGSLGGCIAVEAGLNSGNSLESGGQLSIDGKIDAGAGSCSSADGCAKGGDVDLRGCDVVVGSNGHVLARAGGGGSIEIRARKTLTNNGEVNSSRSSMSVPEGTVTLTYPIDAIQPPGGGNVLPLPTLMPLPLCESIEQANCLVPCPTCGNGQIEFPEACDDGAVLNCDGCTARCQVENCQDGLLCTTDLCDPQFGCYFVALPLPCSESPTVTPTITATPTISPTPSQSPTQTLTPLESFTPTRTPTSVPTATATTSPTMTVSPSRTPTPSVTLSPSPSFTPTVSPTPATRGDANCDTRIGAADLTTTVVAIGSQQIVCGVDAKPDGVVDSGDLDEILRRMFL